MSGPAWLGAKRRLLVYAGAIWLWNGAVCAAQELNAAPQAPTENKEEGEEEIVVVGTPRPATPIDGKSYDQTDNPVAQTGSAADVLDTVPSVNVSPDGNVTLRGSGNVEILINGRRTAATSGADRGLTLQSMAGSDIASIEVITNPSARYGAGGAGIINIVLKEDRPPGARAVLTANFGAYGRKNGAVNANWTRRSLSLNLTLGGRNDLRRQEATTSTISRDDLGRLARRREQYLPVDARRLANTFVAGAEYRLSSQTTLALEGSRKENSSANVNDELNRQFDENDALIREFVRHSGGPRRHVETGVDASLRHEGERRSEWRLTLSDRSASDYRDKTFRDTFAVPRAADEIVRVLTDTDHRVSRATGDGVAPLSSASQLSAGFEILRIHDEFVNFNADIDPGTGSETVNSDLTSRVAATRRAGAGYLTYQRPIGPFTVLAGLRFEAAETLIDPGGSTPRISRSDSNLNPSLHLRFDLGRDREVGASLSKISQRPDLADLNPFPVYMDSENLTFGNPDLQPQRVTSAELGYASKLGELDQTVTAYYRRSRNTVTDFSLLNADDVLLTTKRNAGEGRSAGLAYTLNGSLTSTLGMSLNANIFYAEVQALDLEGPLRNSGVSYVVRTDLDYSPTDKDRLRLEIVWSGESITAQGVRSGTAIWNAAWVHRFTPQLSLNVRINNITNGDLVRTSTETAAVSRRNEFFIRGPVSFLGLQYRLRR